jgi:hypothetical protein
MNRRKLLLLAAAFWGAVLDGAMAGPTPTPDYKDYVDPRSLSYTREYTNTSCGFKITIPRELTGFGNAPFGNHGIFIPLSKDKNCGSIEIFNGYNATFSKSAGAHAGGFTRVGKKSKDVKNWKLLSDKPDRIQGFPAYRVEYSYTSGKSGTEMRCVDIFFMTSVDKKGNLISPSRTAGQLKMDFKAGYEDADEGSDGDCLAYSWILSFKAKGSEFTNKKKLFEKVLSTLKLIKPSDK